MLSASNLTYLYRRDPSLVPTPNRPPNGRHRGHVTKMRTDGYHITEFSSSPGTDNYAYVHGGIVRRVLQWTEA